MQYNHSNIDEKLAKWLAGEANDAELSEINEWIQQSAENKAYCEQFERLWELTPTVDSKIDMEKAWNNISLRTIQKKSSKLRLVYRATAWIAASLVLLLLGRIFLEKNSKISPDIVAHNVGIFIQSGAQSYQTTLPDETIVILAPHSKIVADTGFNSNNRTVTLEGSAWFQTQHGKKQVFTVKHKNTEIRDIGTAFFVNDEKDETKVIVTEGRVEVAIQGHKLALSKGDSVLSNSSKSEWIQLHPQLENTPQEIKSKILVFSKTELKKVIQTINNLYHSDIRISAPKLENCKFTGSFDNENIDTILEVLRDAFNLEIRTEGNITYLEGKGCQ